MLNTLSIISLVTELIGPVETIVTEAQTNDDIITKIQKLSPTLAGVLTGIGGELFPSAKPTLQLIGGLVASFSPSTVKWIQGSLNTLLGSALSPQLVVDGSYGPKTIAAVEQLQTQYGIAIDGIAGQVTQGLIQALVNKLPNLTPAPKAA